MSLSRRQQHQLHRIETGLLRSDPQLTVMLGICRHPGPSAPAAAGELTAAQTRQARPDGR
jgi:hypothetical protein